jgi:hypothetical protein
MVHVIVEFEHAIGDQVLITSDGLPGVVLGLCAQVDGLTYKVAWWDCGQRHVEWLYSFEVRPGPEKGGR